MSPVRKISELNALVSMIDEPNDIMFSEIHDKVMSFGKLAIPVLEEAWVNTFADNDSKRIENLIDEIRQKEFVLDFTTWANDSSKNIIEGLIILTRYLKPDFEEDISEKNWASILHWWILRFVQITFISESRCLFKRIFCVYQA